MTHHHHHHHHDHDHDTESTLSFDEKMIKRLEHWLTHNDSHAETYRDWARQAKANDMDNVGLLLEQVAEMTALISVKFSEALEALKQE